MEYKVSELAKEAGVTKRTIHYYISKGLLMPPMGNGVNSVYNDSHLERLNLIKQLQSEYMPLNKIRDYIFEGEIPQKNTTKPLIPRPNRENPDEEIYIRENVCNIFEMHYSPENAEKYKHIIENVKNYVKKMLED